MTISINKIDHANKQPRWRMTERTVARLMQIKRDSRHTWDSLFVEMLHRYESESGNGGHQLFDVRTLSLIAGKMDLLQLQFKGLSEQMERHGVVIQTIEPSIEQTNRLLGQVVGLLQLAYGIENKSESGTPDAVAASKLQQFIKRRGKR